MREDLHMVVAPFFNQIRNYDKSLDGDLVSFLLEKYHYCLSFKADRVDYSFLPEQSDLSLIKKQEDMLIACHAFKIALSSIELNPNEIENIYNNFKKVGESRGWKISDFNDNCLDVLGVEIRMVGNPIYDASILYDSDYN